MDTFVQLLSTAFALFLLMDPIGNVPIFISVLKDIDPKRQQRIILRELVIALIIIIAFDFLGDLLLEFLNVDGSTLLIAGGIILFIIALKMIFPGRKDPDVDVSPEREPFIVPLAIPLVAGPAVLAAVMLYSHEHYSEWTTIGAIVLAWLASTLILLSASRLKKLLGARGLIACERLMGLLLILISVQMFLSGLMLFLGLNTHTSRLQNSSTQQNRPFEALCDPASSPTLSGMVSSAGHGQPLLSSQNTPKSSIFLSTGVLQPARTASF